MPYSTARLVARRVSARRCVRRRWLHMSLTETFTDTTIAARQHFFGLDNVDPRTGAVRDDRVLLSWMGVSSFAASFNGHVVLLDAWIPRRGDCVPEGVPCPGKWNHSMKYIGSTPDEIAALRPEVYFFGHAHFDHCG